MFLGISAVTWNKNPTNHNLPTYISLVMLFQWALTGLCHRSFESFSKSVGAINCPFVFSFRYRNESGEMVENKRFWSLLNVVPFSQTNVGPSLISNATHIPQYRHHPLFFIEGLLFRFSSLTDPNRNFFFLIQKQRYRFMCHTN